MMTDETRNQVGATVRQLRAILQAADDVDSDSLLLRTMRGDSDSRNIEVWLFSKEEEGIVGMIEVGASGKYTNLTNREGLAFE